MRFSSFFSLLLASTVFASPIANLEVEARDETSLITRAPATTPPYQDSWAYTAAIQAHGGLTKDNYYYFTLEWDLPTPVGEGDVETQDELQQLQQKLGFEHIGLVVGTITETDVKGPKNTVKAIKRDFVASVYHMIKTAGTTSVTPRNYGDYYKSETLKWGGQTTKAKAAKAKTAATGYTKEGKQGTYDVNTNNCNTFVTAVKKGL